MEISILFFGKRNFARIWIYSISRERKENFCWKFQFCSRRKEISHVFEADRAGGTSDLEFPFISGNGESDATSETDLDVSIGSRLRAIVSRVSFETSDTGERTRFSSRKIDSRIIEPRSGGWCERRIVVRAIFALIAYRVANLRLFHVSRPSMRESFSIVRATTRIDRSLCQCPVILWSYFDRNAPCRGEKYWILVSSTLHRNLSTSIIEIVYVRNKRNDGRN